MCFYNMNISINQSFQENSICPFFLNEKQNKQISVFKIIIKLIKCVVTVTRGSSQSQLWKTEPGCSIDLSQNYRSPCLNEWWSCRTVGLTWQAAKFQKKRKKRGSWSLNLNATIAFALTITIHHRKYWQNDQSAIWMCESPCANHFIIKRSLN